MGKGVFMPITNNVMSDEMYQRYRADVAETEALIAAVRASRERAERFTCNSSIRGFSINKHGTPHYKVKIRNR